MNIHLPLVAAASFLLIGQHISLQANTTTSNKVSILNEYLINAPDVPDLPQSENFLCGDVHEDGLVNVLDIITMVNYIMGGNPSPFDSEAADVNADGGINVLDVSPW